MATKLRKLSQMTAGEERNPNAGKTRVQKWDGSDVGYKTHTPPKIKQKYVDADTRQMWARANAQSKGSSAG